MASGLRFLLWSLAPCPFPGVPLASGSRSFLRRYPRSLVPHPFLWVTLASGPRSFSGVGLGVPQSGSSTCHVQETQEDFPISMTSALLLHCDMTSQWMSFYSFTYRVPLPYGKLIKSFSLPRCLVGIILE